jgi:hypothetical protein
MVGGMDITTFYRTLTIDKHKCLIALVIFGDIVYDVLEGIEAKVIKLA